MRNIFLASAVLNEYRGQQVTPRLVIRIMRDMESGAFSTVADTPPPFLPIAAEEAAAFDRRAGEAFAQDSRLRFMRSTGGMRLEQIVGLMSVYCSEDLRRLQLLNDDPTPVGVVGYLPEVLGMDKGVSDRLRFLQSEAARLGLPPHEGFGSVSLLTGVILADYCRGSDGTWLVPPGEWISTDGQRLYGPTDKVNLGHCTSSDLGCGYYADFGWPNQGVGGLVWGLFTGS